MSPELKQFYRDVQAILDAGQERDDDCLLAHRTLSGLRQAGLCNALHTWVLKNLPGEGRSAYYRLNFELINQFQDAGLSTIFPFDPGVETSVCVDRFAIYHDQAEARTLYDNPERRAWVKEHAA